MIDNTCYSGSKCWQKTQLHDTAPSYSCNNGSKTPLICQNFMSIYQCYACAALEIIVFWTHKVITMTIAALDLAPLCNIFFKTGWPQITLCWWISILCLRQCPYFFLGGGRCTEHFELKSKLKLNTKQAIHLYCAWFSCALFSCAVNCECCPCFMSQMVFRL